MNKNPKAEALKEILEFSKHLRKEKATKNIKKPEAKEKKEEDTSSEQSSNIASILSALKGE